MRLIPVDTSSAPAGSVRPGWITFIYTLLPKYMDRGPSVFNAEERRNFFVQQLIRWENPDFRREGVEWLNKNEEVWHKPIYIDRLLHDADLVIPIGCLRHDESLGYFGIASGIFP